MTRITVETLSKAFGDTVAITELSFTAEPGRLTGLLGPNGAGKTTTLRLLLGLARPDAGRALIGGVAYPDLADPLGTVGAVLEGSPAHPGRSGRNHLRVLAELADRPFEWVEDALEAVGLAEDADRRVKGYSLGMRQRLGLAAALLANPSVLVLDEPANGLDPAGMRWLRQLLRGFADTGGTVVLSSHVLTEIAQIVDDVVVVDDGRCLAAGPVEDVAGDRSHLEDAYLALTQPSAAFT
jgi:ABC-2 type transport system ATP-binding protein